MVRGFIRLADGQITAPISVPGSLNGTTYIAGLNNTGMASGHYETGSGVDGFLYSNSTFTTVHMDAYETDVEKVNDAGNYCGSTIAPSAAFVSIGGVLTTFNIPGADGTGAEGINNFDQVVGGYTTGETTYGYRRDADGTLSYPFTVPGAWFTTLRAINDRGWIVGTVSSNTTGTHGVLFRSPESYVLYDYPGAGTTTFNGINSSGLICGNFYDNKNNPHVFVVRARPVAGE